jgi:hypothetical protein
MNKGSTHPAVILLWALGAILSVASLVFAVLSGLKDCDGNAMCSMSSAIEMLFSVMGVFVGALIVVGGFALKSSRARKDSDTKYREEMSRLIGDIRPTKSE